MQIAPPLQPDAAGRGLGLYYFFCFYCLGCGGSSPAFFFPLSLQNEEDDHGYF